MKTHIRNRSNGFTLPELLVVIGIIALLIAMLMPAMSKARRAANTVVCASNMRQITMAMAMYADSNKGAILGNAWTTGAFLKAPGTSFSDSNCPTVCQTWDWTSPVATILGYKFEDGGSIAQRTARFDYLCNLPPFQCPENDILSPPFSGSPVQVTTKMLPYVTAVMFQYQYSASGGDISKFQNFIPTGTYVPKITKVGDTATKIFIADGARWTNADNMVPDYNLGWDNSGTSPGGQYADYGPWSAFSRSYLQTTPITYAMRHGTQRRGMKLGSFRFNAAFFDGHVETLDGATGSNPRLWVPKGTSIPSSEVNVEARAQYMKGLSSLTVN